MKIKSNLYNLLKDSDLCKNMTESAMKDGLFDNSVDPISKGMSFFDLIAHTDGMKVYYISDSVIKMMDMIVIKGAMNWPLVINACPTGKRTFIFPDGVVIRMVKGLMTGEHNGLGIFTCLFRGNELPNGKLDIRYNFFYRTDDGNQPDNHKLGQDVLDHEKLLYRLLCFLHMTESQEEIIKPGGKTSGNKLTKIVNPTSDPIIVVTKNWNISSIRTEGFGVKGHFAIRMSGPERKIPRLVFIEPFMKKGYVRKSTKTK